MYVCDTDFECMFVRMCVYVLELVCMGLTVCVYMLELVSMGLTVCVYVLELVCMGVTVCVSVCIFQYIISLSVGKSVCAYMSV